MPDTMLYTYNEAGEPIPATDIKSWTIFLRKNAEVSLDECGKFIVSTRFLGVIHGGLLFETIIFDGSRVVLNSRYRTLTEAQTGHADAVTLAKVLPDE